ncbi:MAG: type II toxin-antitoxin system PemK/MazF family toxin [Alphaproteobacteria bacterium]|nr:type II toxin-antitoxin system PemK/MazF family toxin [Alphaproteobacteria bacterium]
MKRGEVWSVALGGPYTSKPRPAVIVQDDHFDATNSITICALTTAPEDVPFARPVVEPNDTNGLRAASSIMVDKITTVPRSRLGRLIGHLGRSDMVRLDRAMMTFLGLAA